VVTPVEKRNAVVHLCETHGVSQPLPDRRLHSNLPRGGGRVMCCRVIDQLCGICRVVAMTLIYAMRSNGFPENGAGLVAAPST